MSFFLTKPSLLVLTLFFVYLSVFCVLFVFVSYLILWLLLPVQLIALSPDQSRHVATIHQ